VKTTSGKRLRIQLECTDASPVLIKIKELSIQFDLSIKEIDLALKDDPDGGNLYKMDLTFRLVKPKGKVDVEGFLASIAAISSVEQVISAEY